MTDQEREQATVVRIYESIRAHRVTGYWRSDGRHLAQLEHDLYEALERWWQARQREGRPLVQDRPPTDYSFQLFD